MPALFVTVYRQKFHHSCKTIASAHIKISQIISDTFLYFENKIQDRGLPRQREAKCVKKKLNSSGLRGNSKDDIEFPSTNEYKDNSLTGTYLVCPKL